MCILDKHPALFDLQHAVGKIAELKDITRHAFKRKVFIQAADEQAFGLQDDIVIKLVGNRAAVGNGRQACTAARPQHPIHGITMQVGPAPSPPRVEAIGQHLHHI